MKKLCAIMLISGVLFAGSADASAVRRRLGQYIPNVSVPKVSLPSVNLPSLPSFGISAFKPEALPGTLNKIVTILSALKANSLRTIIKNQSNALNSNLEAFMQNPTTMQGLKVAKNIVYAAAAAIALGAKAAGTAAAVAIPAYVGGKAYAGSSIPVPKTFGSLK